MGWLFSDQWRSKSDLVSHLTQPSRFGQARIISSKLVGNRHWFLAEGIEGRRWIGLDLLESGTQRNPGWGYKCLDESVGPYYFDCPLSFIRMASEPINDTSRQWRSTVLEHHARSRLLSKRFSSLKAGLVLTYGEDQYQLICLAGPRLGWTVSRLSDGRAFRMSPNQIKSALAEVHIQ